MPLRDDDLPNIAILCAAEVAVMAALATAARRLLPRSARRALAAVPAYEWHTSLQVENPNLNWGKFLDGVWDGLAQVLPEADADDVIEVCDGYVRGLIFDGVAHCSELLAEALCEELGVCT